MYGIDSLVMLHFSRRQTIKNIPHQICSFNLKDHRRRATKTSAEALSSVLQKPVWQSPRRRCWFRLLVYLLIVIQAGGKSRKRTKDIKEEACDASRNRKRWS